MTIAENIRSIQKAIVETAVKHHRDPNTIQLVAVSKRHPMSAINEAIAADFFLFGENYMQEASEKIKMAPDKSSFHFIGHIQSNKAKTAAELFSMVETVDRYKLAKALNKHLHLLDKQLDILIQVNIGNDPNKSGVTPGMTQGLLKQIKDLTHLRPLGLMTIPPLTKDKEESATHFRNLRLLSIDLAQQGLFANKDKVELSMGMSHDFRVAIREGATIVRIGTAIFGARPATHPNLSSI